MTAPRKTILKSRVFPFAGGCIAGWLAVLVLIALIVWGIISTLDGLNSDEGDFPGYQTFDSALWLDQELPQHHSNWPPRLRMVDDLLASKVLRGATRYEVEDLLGPSPDTGWPRVTEEGNSVITYYVGPERGPFGIDSEWLRISFSDNDTVVRAWLATD